MFPLEYYECSVPACLFLKKTLSEAALNDFHSFVAAEHERAPVLSPCVSPHPIRVRGFCFLQDSVAPQLRFTGNVRHGKDAVPKRSETMSETSLPVQSGIYAKINKYRSKLIQKHQFMYLFLKFCLLQSSILVQMKAR